MNINERKNITDTLLVENIVRAIHQDIEDIESLNLIETIQKAFYYELKEIEISKIPNHKEFCVSEDKIDKFMKMDSNKMLPIVVDHNYNIIDGSHRVVAAYKLNKLTIKAFVGSKTILNEFPIKISKRENMDDIIGLTVDMFENNLKSFYRITKANNTGYTPEDEGYEAFSVTKFEIDKNGYTLVESYYDFNSADEIKEMSDVHIERCFNNNHIIQVIPGDKDSLELFNEYVYGDSKEIEIHTTKDRLIDVIISLGKSDRESVTVGYLNK